MLAAAACAVADVAATGWMSCALLLLDGCSAAVAAHRRTGTGKSLNCSNKFRLLSPIKNIGPIEETNSHVRLLFTSLGIGAATLSLRFDR